MANQEESNQHGLLVRELRLACGLSMGKLARLLNVSVTYISDVENGHKVLTVHKAKEAATILGNGAEKLVMSAARSRGRIELPYVNTPEAERAGASLMRRWPLSPAVLSEISNLIDEDES